MQLVCCAHKDYPIHVEFSQVRNSDKNHTFHSQSCQEKIQQHSTRVLYYPSTPETRVAFHHRLLLPLDLPPARKVWTLSLARPKVIIASSRRKAASRGNLIKPFDGWLDARWKIEFTSVPSLGFFSDFRRVLGATAGKHFWPPHFIFRGGWK